MTSTSRDDTSQHDRVFRTAVVVGAAPIAYGVWLVVGDPARTMPLATLRRFVVLLLLHDLALMPAVFLLAALLLRRVADPWRAPLRFALVVSGAVLLVAAWGLAGQAIEVQPGNTHVLPNHYPSSVLLLLTPVWTFTLGWGLRVQRDGRRPARLRPPFGTRDG
jgi:hypothetical protein